MLFLAKSFRGLAVRPSTASFNSGLNKASLTLSGSEDWLNMMIWKALHGSGSRRMLHWSKRLWRENPSALIPLTGEKNGSKRSVLVDERGVPLSFVVTAANRHDCKVLSPLLAAKMADAADEDLVQNLCLDAGYVGKGPQAMKAGYVPHIRPRGEEKKLKESDPLFEPKRWVVECCLSWFNRYRKLIPRYEKTDASYNALTALAAAMITLNKVMVIYG